MLYSRYIILKSTYTLLLGIFLTFFVGVGINTFYPEPIYPTPAPCVAPTPNGTAPLQFQDQCQKAQEEIMQKAHSYSQVVATVSLIGAVVYLALGFTILKNITIFSYGFLFGSMFTFCYALFRGITSGSQIFSFVTVIIAVGVVMTTGYFFIKIKD